MTVLIIDTTTMMCAMLYAQDGMPTPFSGSAIDSALASFEIAEEAATAGAVRSSVQSMVAAFSLMIVVVVGIADFAWPIIMHECV